MELRLGSGALGCRTSVEECGAVPVSRQDLIRVWGALGFRKYEDFGGFSGGGGDGSCGWRGNRGWAWFAPPSCHCGPAL